MDKDFPDAELAGWPDPVARLRQALRRNEFALFCQPILALGGGPRYPMAEVLIRLREEERALLPPGDFLPVFEHYRMLPELDGWVVRHALRRLAAGSKVPRLALNVSGQTLEDERFARFVAREISASTVPAQALLFEVDESDVLERGSAVARFAAAIKAMGSGLLIGGYGRKAVSLAPLKALRADYVKIDGRLVRKVLTNKLAASKIAAVLRAAGVLGFGVVAECVEEQDVLLRLKALGVGYAQGFGIAAPCPLDAIAA